MCVCNNQTFPFEHVPIPVSIELLCKWGSGGLTYQSAMCNWVAELMECGCEAFSTAGYILIRVDPASTVNSQHTPPSQKLTNTHTYLFPLG